MAKITRTFSCLLVFSVLIAIGSYGRTPHHLVKTKMPVKINDCTTTDPIQVKVGDPVTWEGTDSDYTIIFEQKNYYPGGNPTATPQNITPFPGSNPPYTIAVQKGKQATWDTTYIDPSTKKTQTPTNCSNAKHPDCYFKYSIVQNGIICADPGVLVQPDGPGLSSRRDGQKSH